MIHDVGISDVVIRHKKFLFFLFFLSFAIRAAVFMGYFGKNENYWQVDSQTYHLVAQQVAQGNGLASADGSPHFYRLPGYPIYLGLFYYLFGVDTKKVLWPQIVVASAIPILVFLLSMMLFPGVLLVAKCAALWAAIHLGFVLFSSFFMTESWFLFLFLLFLIFFLSGLHLFFCRHKDGKPSTVYESFSPPCSLLFPEPAIMGDSYIRFCDKCSSLNTKHKAVNIQLIEGDPAIKAMFLAGVFLGLASMFRPVGHYLLVLAGLMLLFSNDSLSRKFVKFSTLAFAWLLPVSFWLVRNFIFTGHLFFHTLPGGHFLYLSAARVAMHTQHCSYQDARQNLQREVQHELIKKERELGRPLLEIEQCQVHEHLAIKYFRQSPLIAVKNWCTDMFRTMFSLYSSELLFLDAGRQSIDYFKKERSLWNMFERYLFSDTDSCVLNVVVWSEIFLFIIMLFGVLGYLVKAVLSLLRGKNEPLCVFGKCLPFIALFIVIALSGGYARMRLPIEPLLIVLACAFWVKLLKTKGKHE